MNKSEKYCYKNKKGERKVKKRIIYFMLWIASIMFIIHPVQASSSDLLLNHLAFEAQINQDGSMKVTEKWNIKINDTNTLYKTFKIDKTKYSSLSNVTVADVTSGKKQSLLEQKQWGYHLPKGSYFGGMNRENQFEIAWGVGLEDSSATRIYEISYQVKDAIAKYSDYAELYWQFVGEEFEIDAKNITGTIFLPKHVKAMDHIKVWGHTEDLNGEIHATDTNKIEFNIDQFRSGRYVEIRTLFPTEMITNTSRGEDIPRLESVIQEETKWADQANARRQSKENSKKIVSIMINIIAIISTIVSIHSIFKNVKKIKTRKKFVPSQEIKYYREMPREDATPAEALSIFEKQIGNSVYTQMGRIFSATLLDLSLKKIIELEANGKNIKLKIIKENPVQLDNVKDEKVIFEFLRKACQNNQNEITVKKLEKYIKKSQSKVLKLKNDLDITTEQAIYQKELADKKGKEETSNIIGCIIGLGTILMFSLVMFTIFSTMINLMGMIPFIIVGIIQIIVYIVLANKTNILTQKGVDERAKWKGLKKYMEDFSMLDKREIPEIVIWEKFLVYATVFNIAEKVIKQLKIVYPNSNEEFNINTYSYMYLMMNTNFSSSFSNAISSSISTAYSSATGGGGGFSAGGRGTVGGRWRGRRKIKEPLP